MSADPADPAAEPRPRLVLASASPRRRELLTGLGVPFTVRPADVDEAIVRRERTHRYVARVAQAKAVAVAQAGELVLAADTTVALGGRMLGKPASDEEATEMLEALSGRRHRVLTGVAVYAYDRDLLMACVEMTSVSFATLSEEEIAWYVASGEPRDKAGAYAIQGRGALFVNELKGSWSNVVGLPIRAVYRLLAAAGYDLRAAIPGP